MVLVNTSPNSLNADFHSVPTVHLQDTDRAAVEGYAATAGATATISKAFVDLSTPAPFIAGFSSRGPQLAGAGESIETGCDRAGRGYPCGGRTHARAGKPGLQPFERHIHGDPTCGWRGSFADATASDLVADDDQIGTDDDRHGRARWPEQLPNRHLRSGRWPY